MIRKKYPANRSELKNCEIVGLFNSGNFHVTISRVSISVLKYFYDQTDLMPSLSQKRFLFSLSEVAVPVSVIEVNFGAL